MEFNNLSESTAELMVLQENRAFAKFTKIIYFMWKSERKSISWLEGWGKEDLLFMVCEGIEWANVFYFKIKRNAKQWNVIVQRIKTPRQSTWKKSVEVALKHGLRVEY